MVLQGAHALIRRYHPTLLLEINTKALAAAGESVSSVVEQLEDLGYATFQFWPDLTRGGMLSLLARLLPHGAQCDILVRHGG
jgi:hypothetical protein